MSEFNFEDFDAVAGARRESASFEEIALNQPPVLRALRADAEGLCLQTSLICSGVRVLSHRVLNHLSPTVRVVAPDDARVVASLLQSLETAALTLNAVSRAILATAEDAVMAEGPQIEEEEEAPEEGLSMSCQILREQFFGAARELGLSVRHQAREARLAALADFLGRKLISADALSEAEWVAVIEAVEDGRLKW